MSKPLGLRFAEFVTGLDLDSLPADVARKAKTCLYNGYGIGLGCHGTPYAPVARAAALAMDGERADGATMLGDGRKTSVAGAALAGSALFHGRAQEDSCGAAHLGTILIPLLTALVEARDIPVARLLPALVAGYEIGGALEANYAGQTTPGGLRASPLYGSVGAAAAVANLLGLNADRTQAALANAAHFSGGILQSFADGTDEWRYQVGMSGRIGLVAAELARAGSVASPLAFEGKAGFVKAFARVDCDTDAIAGKLGQEWQIRRVTFKPFPVCAFNQTPVTAALEIRDKLNGKPIKAARVRMNPYECGYAGMDATGPFQSISGTLMSIPFCIAATLVHGRPSMEMMTTYDDAAVNALESRITLVSDPEVPTLSAKIDLEFEDGATLSHDQPMTVADFDFDWDRVAALVRGIGAEQGIPATAYDRIADFAEGLPDGDIGQVLAAFAELP